MSRKKNGLENLVLITQLGINVITPVFLCLIAGSWIDRKFGLKTILFWLILGVLSGGLSAYRMARQTIEKERKAEEEERKAREARWIQEFGDGDGAGRDKRQRW